MVEEAVEVVAEVVAQVAAKVVVGEAAQSVAEPQLMGLGAGGGIQQDERASVAASVAALILA